MPDAAFKNDIIFISADHRLLFPSTGFDIIEDIKKLFDCLAAPDFSSKHLPQGVALDSGRIAVVGESGGGYAARAAGIFAKPKPRAIMLQFAMGGELLDDHWLSIKDASSTPAECKGVRRVALASLLDEPQQPISYDPLIALGEEPLFPGQKPSRRRMLLLYWLVHGELVDQVLGQNLSHDLRKLAYDQRMDAIPEALRPAILQSQLDETFPPTFLMHGKADTLILPRESQHTYQKLRQLGVRTELELLDGADHGLREPPSKEKRAMLPGPNSVPKLVDGAEEIQKKAFEFILSELRASSGSVGNYFTESH